jgi:protein tyrosine phosphatase (PTP) superfamily phosphohydrolase (DUF442 family)
MAKVASQHLPNLVRVVPKVYSGGLPEGEAAFQELAALGIRTIISVDGMKPEWELAQRYGLTYVHLPHGYDGIAAARSRELAKAVRDLPGPIYIHCHHGKHRSPAAAAVACVSGGLLPPEEAVSVLRLAGTSPHYRGLYQVADEALPVTREELDDLAVEFRPVSEVPPMAEAMIEMEHRLANLQRIAQAGWQVPTSHPDLVPAHEALLLRELYAEMLRSEEVAHESEAFRGWLQEGEQQLATLESLLRRRATGDEEGTLRQQLNQSQAAIESNCQGCHHQYRDLPKDR